MKLYLSIALVVCLIQGCSLFNCSTFHFVRPLLLTALLLACLNGLTQDTIPYKEVGFAHYDGHMGPGGYYYYQQKPFTGVAKGPLPGRKGTRVAHFEMGMLHGSYLEWHPNGQKKTNTTYHHGKLLGKKTRWHENGQLESISTHFYGPKYDTSKVWYANGNLKRIEWQQATDTVLYNYTHYYDDGTKKYELRPTYQQSWHPNGKMKREGKIQNEQCIGTWKTYNEEGRLIKKEKWENGKIVSTKDK